MDIKRFLRNGLLLLSIQLAITSYAQETATRNIGLSPMLYKKVLNQQFTNLITGQSKNSIGNFGALDLKEAEVSFAGNAIFNNGSVLGLKASGAVSDGLLSLFENNTFNNQVSL